MKTEHELQLCWFCCFVCSLFFCKNQKTGPMAFFRFSVFGFVSTWHFSVFGLLLLTCLI